MVLAACQPEGLQGPRLSVEREIISRGFFAFSARSALQGVNQVFLIIQGVFGGIGAIALIVAAFGIANTMLMAIYERTREIGLMKAVGATNRDVWLPIFALLFSALVGVVSGVYPAVQAASLDPITALKYE